MKSWRTLFFNGAIVAAIALLQWLVKVDWTAYVDPTIAVIIVGAVNLILRFITTGPVASLPLLGGSKINASPFATIAALLVVAGMLTGCAQVAAVSTRIDSGLATVERAGNTALLRTNTALVAAQPNVTLWAGRCAVALGYVQTIAAVTGLISASAQAQAARAAAACQSVADNPPADAAALAHAVGNALTVLQSAAQVPAR